ncbi:MAG: type II toxin-antitoxin system VapC family toxin [Geminicoccaceae bacterium]|nr:type II toxin-antitoxin system VapC family toxin [Geminicoccaceae bacterium]
MRLLLDTHVVLWWLAGDRRLSAAARGAIVGGGEILVSAASVWEMAIKAGLGRLELPKDLGGFLSEQLRVNGFEVLPVGLRHAAVRDLPRHHPDPFDRLLVAQARVEGAALVTQDAKLRAYEVACVG